jgi:hypothetical protein
VLLVALHAFQHGKKAKLCVWMEERYGTKPDTILGVWLRDDALRITDDTDVGTIVAFVRDLVDGHNVRLTEKIERGRSRDAEKMLDGRSKSGELGRALNQYDGDDQVTEVHRAMFEAEKSLQPGEVPTSGEVEWRVRYDNRPSHVSVDSPRKKQFNPWGKGDPVAFSQWLWHTAAPRDESGVPSDQIARLDDPDLPDLSRFFEDPHSLALYDAVHNKLLLEWLDILVQQRLSSRELEVLAMMRHGYKQSEMAARLGITEGRVSQLVSQVQIKLADIA